MRAQVVIGGMFGDEGKGLVTDYLAFEAVRHNKACTVVRFNGGAQAGHTVARPNGFRHVFHHVGSGALAGASTYLGQRFVIHPMLFLGEYERVMNAGGSVDIKADPRCPITTPYDIMINQALEQARGIHRHGSCGMGFGETLQRNEHQEHALCLGDLLRGEAHVRAIVQGIRHHYLPYRLQQLHLENEQVMNWSRLDSLADRFIKDMQATSSKIQCARPEAVLPGQAVVFEGAQGLALDQDMGAFPHVTRSCTGLPYVLEVASEAGIDELAVHYGTRAYTTRHGAGPLQGEDGCAPEKFSDPTNQPNDYQGQLRFAPLWMDEMKRLVAQDLLRAKPAGISIEHGIWVSCLDQMPSLSPVQGHGLLPTSDLASYVASEVKGRWALHSKGPYREALERGRLA